MCTFLRNNPVKLVFNEDIATCDSDRLVRIVNREVGPIAALSIGLQCDDFSNAKSPALKRQEMAEFRPSSRELGYYATKLIEKLQPASVFIENVSGWHGSESQAVLGAVLTRLGYHVQAKVLNGADFGAFTARKRCYFVASIFPGFTYPSPPGPNRIPLRSILNGEIGRMADVTHTSSVQQTRGTPRQRFATFENTTAPTVLKSQARCTKDALYFEENGRILRPTLEALRILHGIPNSIRLDAVSTEIAIEQIGQGIEFPLHSAVAQSLYAHLAINHQAGAQLSLNL